MKIVIIGWFGTETIGDRAILSACIRMISEIFSPNIISLGSLNTFFTERTLNEDSRTYSIEGHTNINIFDATSSFIIKNELKQSDLLLMAGGPIMGIEALNMINYSFCYAKKIILRMLY